MFRFAPRATRVLAATRGIASVAASTSARNASRVATAVAGATGVAGAIALGSNQAQAEFSLFDPSSWFGSGGGDTATPAVWEEVRSEIKAILDDDENLGPFFVRLAWHCAGSYDASDDTGGSMGATMRFAPESDHGGNAGLGEARDLLESVKTKFPDLSYADIYTFAGKAAVEAMGGPAIPWQPGRPDYVEGDGVTPDGRLPDGDKGADHLRAIFYRMGFDDREIVALSGAHCLGFCHDDRSGFVGPWTPTPTTFTNDYFDLILNKKWQINARAKQPQFENADDQTLMMLTTDMALLTDFSFRTHVDRYAADEKVFFAEFAAAFGKLLELGVKRA